MLVEAIDDVSVVGFNMQGPAFVSDSMYNGSELRSLIRLHCAWKWSRVLADYKQLTGT